MIDFHKPVYDNKFAVFSVKKGDNDIFRPIEPADENEEE